MNTTVPAFTDPCKNGSNMGVFMSLKLMAVVHGLRVITCNNMAYNNFCRTCKVCPDSNTTATKLLKQYVYLQGKNKAMGVYSDEITVALRAIREYVCSLNCPAIYSG